MPTVIERKMFMLGNVGTPDLYWLIIETCNSHAD